MLATIAVPIAILAVLAAGIGYFRLQQGPVLVNFLAAPVKQGIDQGLQGLTASEIELLAEYLNAQDTDGERRYVTTCAGCHGNDGSGGRVDEDVYGESAGETWEAIASPTPIVSAPAATCARAYSMATSTQISINSPDQPDRR